MAEKKNTVTKKPLGQIIVAAVKEICRKFLVALKRRPSMIPMAAIIIAFLVYSLNMMYVSDTTALIQGDNMGLAGFATMLFSMLSFLVFMNTFPYRKKTNVPMLVIFMVMMAIIIFSDVYYLNGINAALTRAENPITVTVQNTYILYAQYYLQAHIIVLAVAVVLVALLPVYTKLLRKINTNIEVEGNADMGAIDLAGDD